MAGYIKWLGPQIDRLPEALRDLHQRTRFSGKGAGVHLRIPSAISHLWIGIDCMMSYAEEIGAVSRKKSVELRAKCWAALEEVGVRQGQSLEVERPSRRFLSLLSTLIAQNRAFLLGKEQRPESHSRGSPKLEPRPKTRRFLVE
jgi:hypothetical protein